MLAVRARRAARETEPSAARVEPATAEPPGRPAASLWLALYAPSGFCALALEILWFRFLDVAVKSTAFTFGTLLVSLPARLRRSAAWPGAALGAAGRGARCGRSSLFQCVLLA